ncbi:MAG: four helix bundle protein [Deltaproteobacteria bacterium]|nr:four helix bundle protein [Deltaproteobacteria bacterium]
MTKILNSTQYDLEDRTFNFARDVRRFVQNLQKTMSNIEDGKQLTRSSGSVGANYIEANEALSKKVLLPFSCKRGSEGSRIPGFKCLYFDRHFT